MRKTVLALLSAVSLSAGANRSEAAPTAAFLYYYDVSNEAAFNRGYKDHLAWHESKKDHLVWYAWRVVAGSRPGAFVDGTFGASFDAIDRRPDLKGDAAHFGEHVAPYAEATAYEVLQSLDEASTDGALERRQPSPMLDVYFVDVRPDKAAAFESQLAALARSGGTAKPMSWYRSLAGTDLPQYLLMVPRANWAELGDRRGDFASWLATSYGAAPKQGARLGNAITKVRSETWAYRSDLSYFPDK